MELTQVALKMMYFVGDEYMILARKDLLYVKIRYLLNVGPGIDVAPNPSQLHPEMFGGLALVVFDFAGLQ